MEKIIRLSQSIRDICTEYPEVKEIMHAIGFTSITEPGMLNTTGRFMTLPKGAAMKGISLDAVRQELSLHGFTIQE